MAEFNPRKAEKTVISIRIQTSTLETVDSIAADIDLSRNEFIVQCIEYAIEHYNKK
jgi:metal-responsive CopG/Arc/MetJ family transcriptional regulator